MTWSLEQIVPALESTHAGSVFQRLRKDLVVVISTLGEPLIRRWNADESGFKAMKEGLNSLQLLENMAGSGREFRGSVSSCGEDLEKVFGCGLLNWGN